MPAYLPPRAGISQSQALAEASAFAKEVQLLTLAFTHPLIVDPLTGLPMAVYVVNDYQPLVATLEASAPLDGGQQVTFRAVPMEITLPTEADNSPGGEVAITISNVSRELMPHLEAVTSSREPVLVIARTYLPSDTAAPHETPPLRVTLRGASATVKAITARAGYGNTTNRRWPPLEYTQQEFLGLAA